jgi:hypothetical protein
MPVTAASPVETYTISAIGVDMTGPSINVTFSRQLNGVEIGTIGYLLSGSAFNDVFGAHGDATKTRANDIADALYTEAIAAGVISGTLS